MAQLQKLALALLLILLGLHAGMLFIMLIGVIPAIQRMPLETYVATWQNLDHFMVLRMPTFSIVMMLLYLLALISFAKRWKTWIFSVLLICFALNASEIAYTVTHQLAINHAVQALDPAHLADIGLVEQMRNVSVHNFRVREWLSISSFVFLALASMLSIPTSQRIAGARSGQ
jgi:MFS superfamily sulfate permease-like transporter